MKCIPKMKMPSARHRDEDAAQVLSPRSLGWSAQSSFFGALP